MTEGELNALSRQVLDAAFAVHTALGPGLLESVYEACLCRELEGKSISFQRQIGLPLTYKDEQLADVGYRLDVLVAGELIIEVKSVESIAPVHHAQLLTYIRLSGRRLGLLINFSVASLRDGIHRKVNKL